MTIASVPAFKRLNWRLIVYTIVAGLVTLLLLALGGLHAILAPWLGHIWVASEEGIRHPEIHLWHDGQFGALLILLIGSLLTSLGRQRERMLPIQFFALSVGVYVLALAPFDPSSVLFLGVIVSLPIVAHPAFPNLLRFGRVGRISMAFIALSLAAAVLMLPAAWNALRLQVTAADEHALADHWITAVVLTIVLVLAGALAATRRPGWRALGVLTGLTYLYLGAAAISLPNQVGSWGTAGGVASMLGGLAFIIVTLWEAGAITARPTP
jgi:hypothetical protein